MELTNFIEPFFFASLKITAETMSKQKKKRKKDRQEVRTDKMEAAIT